MPETVEARAFELVSRHERVLDLVYLTHAVTRRAFRDKALVFRPLSELVPAERLVGIDEPGMQTEMGNALGVLERGPSTADERALAAALYAHVVAGAFGETPAEEVVWLAAHTPFDATRLLDRVTAPEEFWRALATHALLANDDASVELDGELAPPLRHPATTVALAMTGILLVVAGVRAIAALALAYKRPAQVAVLDGSVRVRTRTVVLGRTLRDKELVFARPGLVRAERELRYPQLAFYAGLVALAIGSVVGVHAFVDGVHAASPSLLFVGVVIVALGVALDFGLSLVARGRAGRCGITLVPRVGRPVRVRGVDASRADAALALLARAG